MAPGRSFGITPPEQLFPYNSTMQLNSKPAAKKTIFIETSGFNLGYSNERNAVQHIWKHVSEDFAPFDVNVTTEQPVPDSLSGSGPNDEIYGYTVIIERTNSWGSSGRIQGEVNFNSFADLDDKRRIMVLKTDQLAYQSEFIAGLVSHMLGHALGLRDEIVRQLRFPGYWTPPANSSEAEAEAEAEIYYTSIPYPGHQTTAGWWTPIMGHPGGGDISQFSRGEYQGATNTTDSYAVIQRNGLSLRTDDHGSTRTQATAIAPEDFSTNGVLERANDRDMFSIQANAGLLTATVNSRFGVSNVNYAVRLFNSAGVQIAIGNPSNSLNGSFRYNIRTPGTYFILVTGEAVNGGSVSPGFTAYGNRGAYKLDTAYTPSIEPRSIASFTTTLPLVAGRSITFVPSLERYVGPVTYSWDFGNGSSYGQSTSFVYYTFPRPGTYTVSMRVQNLEGFNTTFRQSMVVADPLSQLPRDAVIFNSFKRPDRSGIHLLFDASASRVASDDPSGFSAPAMYEWTVAEISGGNPGVVSRTRTSSPDFNYIFLERKAYTMTLRLARKDGSMSAPLTQSYVFD